ncbi:hypothetical protein BZA70DRAFT_296169 [Myxozyma melibiosi]|uniref:Non-structural maintenance of chromosomes element 1 homolog n=1 Tax=Myxozyma melibiosi TaxID=54550 RepID=A0ABR1F3H0_9ASCO
MANDKRKMTDADRALVQAFVANRRLDIEQLRKALSDILNVSNKLQQGDDYETEIEPDEISQEQVEEYIGVLNSELYSLDYEIRCSVSPDNVLTWHLEFLE